MSVNIKRNGTLQKLADQTLIFDANSAETRSGTITVPAISEINGNQSVQVVFSSPMPDTNYEVIIDEGVDTWAHLTATVTNKTTTGFSLMVVTLVPNMPQLNFHYTAFKLVTLEGYSSVQNKINNPDSTPTQNSTNLVTSGGVYDAIKNASSVFIGTASEWESESAKTDYQVAILTDQPTVNAVDSTDGATTVVANKNLVFKGTLEEWEALTTAEKKAYDEALITNDMDTGEIVNGVTDGDMRAVTSNAVYDAITGLTPVDAVTNGNMSPVTSNAVAVGLPEYYSKQLTVTAYEAAQLFVTSAYLRGQKVLCKDGKTRIFGKIIMGAAGNPNGGMNKHPCKLTGFPGPVTILTGRLPCLIWSGWTGFYSMDVVDVANNILAPIIAGPDHSSNEEACFTPQEVVVEVTE